MQLEKIFQRATRILVLFLAFLVTSCAGSGGTIPGAECPKPASALTEYQIGPGDVLNISIWRSPELSTTVPVRPDGRITTPLVDDILASGKTPFQLASDMEAVLSEYLRTPEVSVIVTSQGAANQIQAIGEVNSPQAISYRFGLRLLDLVVAVGGVTNFAAGNRADLVRQIDGKQYKCRVRVDDLLKGELSENIEIYPGDMLVVPETRL
jgi:polysaccharide biosynthesis/export protein